MTTSLDTRLIPKVKSIIERLGKLVTFTRVTRTPNVVTGKVTKTTTTMSRRVSPPEAYKEHFVDGVSVVRGDAKIGMSPSGADFIPTTNDEVTIDSESWSIISEEKVYSGDDVALYQYQIRKTS